MNKFLLSIVTSLAVFGTAKAITVQKIILKNGSELSGYIEKQDGYGKMTIHTDRATVCFSGVGVANISNEKAYNIKSLDKAWVEWAEKNDAFDGTGDNRTLILSDVSFAFGYSAADSIAVETKRMGFEEYLKDNHMRVSKVKVLESGVRTKYLELSPNSYVISWNDVVSIQSDRRPKNALTGINRIYQLKGGAIVEGQYAEETDETLSLYLPNGGKRSIRINDVVKCNFRPINPNQTLFQQAELLDVIRTKGGKEVKGVIVEQNYTNKNNELNYFLVQQESGTTQSVKVSEIVEMRREENPKYTPLFDIVLKEGEVVVNRQPANYVNVKEVGDALVLESMNEKLTFSRDANNKTKIVVEYNNPDASNVELFKLVKISKATVKKNTVYRFSYRDLVNNVFSPSGIETSINHTTKVEYVVAGSGQFALYDSKKNRAIPLTIK